MSFMQPEWKRADVYIVETTDGTEVIPADVVGDVESAADLRDYYRGDVLGWERREQWIGRLSAPGYMDATDWESADSEIELLQSLLDQWGDQCGEPEDWEAELERRIAELKADLAAE